MATNMNLVRASNQLEHVKGEVQARIDRAKDEDGNPSSEIFRIKNPEIEVTMGEWITARTEEANQLQREVNDYLKSDEALDAFNDLVQQGKDIKRAPNSVQAPKGRRLSDELMRGDEWDEFVSKRTKTFNRDSEISLKELFETTTTGAADAVSVESVRTGEVVMVPRTRVTLLDIIPQLTTEYPVVKYDEETLNESNMDTIAQGAVYKESAFRIDEKSVDVVKVGGFIQVSEELLSDRAEMRARLDGSLRMQLMRRIQDDLIGGTMQNAGEYVGTPAADTLIKGFLDLVVTTGSTQEINVLDGEDVNPITSLESAMEAVYRVGQADADAIVMTSRDWLDVSTLQATTGSFIARGAMSGIADTTQMRYNGLPVVICNSLPEHTVLVGAFRDHCAIRDRQSAQTRIQEAQHVPSVAVDADVTAVTQTQPSGRFNIYTDVRYAFYIRRGFAFARIDKFGQEA